jgi:hypothetical protein
MPSGGPGDEPLVDILRWRRPVYSQRIDSLIAELAELSDGLAVEEFLSSQGILWMRETPAELDRAEALLGAKREELYRAARERGWDMEGIDSRINRQRRAVAAAWIHGKSAS